MPDIIIFIVVLAIIFDISNGWNDAANAIATVVSTRVLTPVQAVLLAASMNIAGAFFTTAVAKTIGKGIVDPTAVTQPVVASALFTGFIWNGIMTLIGLPVSASHALIGGLIGVGATKGLSAVRWGVAGKIVIAWVLTLPVCAGMAWLVYEIMALLGYG